MRAILLVCCLAGAAHAGPRVVIVETSDAPSLPALATQVRVYAGQRADVVVVARGETSAEFAGHATEVVIARSATAIVWVARATGGYLVFAAGRWPDRALIELVRIDERTPVREAERTIALKVAALLDSLLVEQPPVSKLLGVPAAPSSSPQPVRAARSWLSLAGAVVRERGDRAWGGRLSLGADRRWWRADVAFAARVGAHWQPASVVDGMLGRVAVQELGIDADCWIAKRYGRWSPFVGAHFSGAALHARGTTNDGRSNAVTLLVPMTGVDVGVRRALSSSAELRFALETDLALIRQRFLLDGVVTADLQRLRVAFAGGLAIAL